MSNNIIKKIANSVAGTGFSLALIAASTASATTFNFYFHNLAKTHNFGGGSLSFDEASLTGNGSEKFALGDLVNANFNFDFNYLSSNLDASNLAGEQIFSFADGELAGIKFLAEKQNNYSETLLVENLEFNFFRTSPVDQVDGQVSFETVTAWQPPDTIGPPAPAGAPYEFSAIPGVVLLGVGYGVNYLWKRWKDKGK